MTIKSHEIILFSQLFEQEGKQVREGGHDVHLPEALPGDGHHLVLSSFFFFLLLFFWYFEILAFALTSYKLNANIFILTDTLNMCQVKRLLANSFF